MAGFHKNICNSAEEIDVTVAESWIVNQNFVRLCTIDTSKNSG